MTRERAKELLELVPIIQAYSEGKTVQMRYPCGPGWKDMGPEDPAFDAHPTCYRIKPEPREFWIDVRTFDGVVRGGYADGIEIPPDLAAGEQRIRVREVL